MNALTILSKLSLPRLLSLRLSRLTGNLDGVLQHLLSITTIAHLEEMIIDRCPIGNVGLVAKVLCVATGLRSVQMTYVANGGEVLEALARPPPPNDAPEDSDSSNTTDPGVLCPQLTSVDFSHCPDVSDGPLVRLIKARNVTTSAVAAGDAEDSSSAGPKIAQLRSVVIDGCDKVDASILLWMRNLVPHVSCLYATKKLAGWRR